MSDYKEDLNIISEHGYEARLIANPTRSMWGFEIRQKRGQRTERHFIATIPLSYHNRTTAEDEARFMMTALENAADYTKQKQSKK